MPVLIIRREHTTSRVTRSSPLEASSSQSTLTSALLWKGRYSAIHPQCSQTRYRRTFRGKSGTASSSSSQCNWDQTATNACDPPIRRAHPHRATQRHHDRLDFAMETPTDIQSLFTSGEVIAVTGIYLLPSCLIPAKKRTISTVEGGLSVRDDRSAAGDI